MAAQICLCNIAECVANYRVTRRDAPIVGSDKSENTLYCVLCGNCMVTCRTHAGKYDVAVKGAAKLKKRRRLIQSVIGIPRSCVDKSRTTICHRNLDTGLSQPLSRSSALQTDVQVLLQSDDDEI